MSLYTIETNAADSRPKLTLTGLVRAIEPLVVLAVGFFAILPERLPQMPVMIALAFLVLPLVLRLFLVGQVTTPSLTTVPLLLFGLLLLITYWVTPSWQYTWPELARMVWGMAVFLAVVNWINPLPSTQASAANERRQGSVRLVVATVAYLALGVAFTTIGLLGMQPTYKIETLGLLFALLPKVYISGVHSFNSNNVAGIIVLFAPLAVALALGPLRLRQYSWALWLAVKIPMTLLALFFSVALLFTQTRGAWLAFACSLVLLMSMLGRRGWLLLALLGVIAASVLTVIGPGNLLEQLTVRDSARSETSLPLPDRNVSARLILWQRALHGIADAPFTGMGLGAFEVVSQQPYPQVKGFVPDADMTHVHNIVLQAGVDFGLPGIIALVALFVIIALLLKSLIRRTIVPSLLHTWSLGLLASFVAFLVYNMTNATTLGSTPSVAVWFLFGLCVGAGEWGRRVLRSAHEGDATSSALAHESDGLESEWSDWESRAWAATAGSPKA
jgi:O-antigen ligase